MSGTLPRTAADPPEHDPARTSRWSLILGGLSLVLGFIWAVPLIAILLGVRGRRHEPDGQRLARWGILLGAVSLVAWVFLLVPLLDLIGFY